MFQQEAYSDLLERVERDGTGGPDEFFRLLRQRYAIANCCYLDVDMRADAFEVVRIHHTFGPWAEIYRARRYHRIDPVFKRSLTAVAPVDWATARAADPDGEAFFAEARRYGIGGEGLTFPLVSRTRHALFAIEAAVSSANWPVYRRSLLPDLQPLLSYFHAFMQGRLPDTLPIPGDQPHLTGREREVLGWVAAGKSYWEIAIILGITERTVRFFMTNVRAKLDAVSNSQAVASAAWLRLIAAE